MGFKPEKIMQFLRNNLSDKPAIIGISSGIDSALVLMLISKAIEKEKVHAYFIPDSGTPGSDYEDIAKLEKSSGIQIQTIHMDNVYNSMVDLLPKGRNMDYGNLKSRIRMSILYFQANVHGGLVIGTTNLSEFLTGYFTKFGDGACDLEPIINLTKSEVWNMAEIMGVPESIIRKPPSAGLWEGQRDEDELGLSYREIDNAVSEFRKNGRFPDTPAGEKIRELYNRSDHKRRLPLALED